MSGLIRSIFHGIFKKQAGQSSIMVALSLTATVGFSGVAIESGHGYYAYQQLVASTNAAALAASQGMPDKPTATANATAYSSKSGQKNASSLLTNVAVTPTFTCSTALAASTSLNLACLPASDGNSYNAIKVTQTADVPSWFGGMFGVRTFHLTYTSAAAIRGGANSPWNIAILMDATNSMSKSDSGTQCSGTRESCALKGVQALLGNLYPCYLGQTCNSSSPYVDAVSLFAFPPPTTATYTYDYCLNGKSPSSIVNGFYVLPNLPTSGSTPPVAQYQITPFSNDYRASDTSAALNTSSTIVKAVGYSGSGCAGIYPLGGSGTYYAQAIYTAQAALVAQKTAHPGSQNAIIILSDGDASATPTYTTTQKTAITTTSDIQPSSTNSLNGVNYHNLTSYTYPSAVGECGQAVVAAQAAATAGTTVFSIGYGATSGCSTDSNYSATVTTGGGSWSHGGTPCKALAAMASSTANFYSDNANGCKATLTTNQSFTSLTAIFRQIVASLSTPRLITPSML